MDSDPDSLFELPMSPPYTYFHSLHLSLTLYEKEIYLSRSNYRAWISHERLGEGDDQDPDDAAGGLDHPRNTCSQIRVHRFFQSILGFYEGCLDLTGRHQHRFDDLMNRFSHFVDEYDAMPSPKNGLSEETLCEIDQIKWNDFRLNWRIPEMHFTYDSLGLLIDQVKHAKEDFRVPKIQATGLLDLSNEVLDLVCQFGFGRETRNLSSTCRRLSAIGRKYSFDVEHIVIMPNFEQSRTGDRCFAVTSARDRFLRRLHFMTPRLDITGHIKRLSVSDYSRDIDLEENALQPNFRRPISRKLANLLSNCRLRRAVLTGIHINARILSGLASSEELYVLSLWSCSFTRNVANAIHRGVLRQFPSILPSIYNLELGMDGSDPYGVAWDIIPMFTNLRTLSVQSHRIGHRTMIPIPQMLDFMVGWTCIHSLQRLILSDIAPALLEEIVIQLGIIAQHTPFSLTHFKLGCSFAVDTVIFIRAVLAIQGSTLRVLALEGLRGISPTTIPQISSLCPDIEILTLIMRHRGDFSAVICPLPSYEYARQLAAFPRLWYFGWNFRTREPSFTPYNLLRFEEGFEAEDMKTREDLLAERELQLYDDDDDQNWFKAFFAMCPRLDTVEYFKRNPIEKDSSLVLNAEPEWLAIYATCRLPVSKPFKEKHSRFDIRNPERKPCISVDAHTYSGSSWNPRGDTMSRHFGYVFPNGYNAQQTDHW